MQILDSKTNFSAITNHLYFVQKQSSENGFFMIIRTLLNQIFLGRHPACRPQDPTLDIWSKNKI